MRTDDGRTIIVVARGPHLPAAVRERIPRDVALVRWADPERLTDAWARCRPWPWVVIGAGEPPVTLPGLVGDSPVVVTWLCPAGENGDDGASPGIPLSGWEGLTGWVRRLTKVRVGNLALAPTRGVRAGTRGASVPAPQLEALLAAYPRGLANCATMRGARIALRRMENVTCTTQVSGGEVRLVVCRPGNTPNGGDCR